ncbi:MAG: (Fe-S)-binding protein [Candidatus Freyarchaeota archaeon]|nr:(Fe-S)-binding protein [Candidatus Jordarchaeia archaeon]MBS7279385.1 (Fe-S)-binding protein [Candidatus Jordarchaeia archaeon]
MSLEKYHVQTLRCNRCSLCKWVPQPKIASWRFAAACPSIQKYNFHAYSGGGRIIIACALLENKIDYTDELARIVYTCSMCGACDVSCKMNYGGNLEPLEIMHALRVKCVEKGRIPPRHKTLLEDIREYDNPYKEPRKKREEWAEGMSIKDLSHEKAEVLYYVGCTSAYRLPGLARTTATILQNAGVDFGILGKEELCCASTAYKIGDEALMEEYAKDNIEKFNSLGVKQVVTSCSGCYHMFKSYYPPIGKMNFDVLHITEYIERLMKEGKIKLSKRVPIKATYHDPCHLGRLAEPHVPWNGVEKKVMGQLIITDPPKEVRFGVKGVYDPPRNILRSIPGLEFVEMERIREYSWCCGSGGGVKAAFPELASFAAAERIEEANATGAEALVTACPFCEINLGDAIREGKVKIKLYDIVELVLEAMRGEGVEGG